MVTSYQKSGLRLLKVEIAECEILEADADMIQGWTGPCELKTA
jgi:hypothetical protein